MDQCRLVMSYEYYLCWGVPLSAERNDRGNTWSNAESLLINLCDFSACIPAVFQRLKIFLDEITYNTNG